MRLACYLMLPSIPASTRLADESCAPARDAAPEVGECMDTYAYHASPGAGDCAKAEARRTLVRVPRSGQRRAAMRTRV
jgi:hypothetical protein